jgi:hypothetical protein
MVSEPEGYDGFVGRALVCEGFNIRESPFATELIVTKLLPPWTPAKVDIIRCTT